MGETICLYVLAEADNIFLLTIILAFENIYIHTSFVVDWCVKTYFITKTLPFSRSNITSCKKLPPAGRVRPFFVHIYDMYYIIFFVPSPKEEVEDWIYLILYSKYMDGPVSTV